MKIPELKPPRRLYNPSLEDISVDVDLLGSNPRHYTLKKHDFDIFPDHVATMIEEKLAERMYWKEPAPNKNREKRMKELLGIIRA